MKTTYSQENIRTFLASREDARPTSIVRLTEGHTSQVFGFETNAGKKLVLRVSAHEADFAADEYAANVFGRSLMVPDVVEIGRYDGKSFYCISEMANGQTTNLLTAAELAKALPVIRQSLADIFMFDVSSTQGYGSIDVKTGNARHGSWHAALSDKIESTGDEAFRANAVKLGLRAELVEAFFAQFRHNLTYASETRRLLHGDPAFDNMLVDGDKVTAVIDWAQMGYGDWVSDFARLDFWWPDRYGDIKSFASEYGFDDDHLDERVALYYATNALWTIEFADRAKSAKVRAWLKKHLKNKLV